MFNAYLHYLAPPSPYISSGSPAWSRLATPRSAFAQIYKPAYKPPNKKPRRATRAKHHPPRQNRCPGIDGATRRPSPAGERGTLEGLPLKHSMERIWPTSGGTTGTPHRGVFRSVPVPVRFVHRNVFLFVPFRSFCSTSAPSHEQLGDGARLDNNEAVLRLLEETSVNK